VGRSTADRFYDKTVSNNAGVRTRRGMCLFVSILGLAVALSACSSSATVQQTSPARSACSLLSTQEASAALGTAVQPPSQCRISPGDQSQALYSGTELGTTPGVLNVNVSWNKAAVHTFTVTHSGHAHYIGNLPPPVYSRVTVSGIAAYWRLNPPPISGLPNARVQMLETLKNGYVVTLISMNLSESQNERAMASIISHL
jgi:hypothetical protein